MAFVLLERRDSRLSTRDSSHAVRAREELRLLPMQLRVGDIVLDRNRDDWEMVSRPVGIMKKQVIARVRVPGRPDTEKEHRWEVYERVSVRRGAAS